MAVTRIIPLHVGGKRSLAAALKKTVDYVKNPEKTDGGQLVTGYRSNPELAAAEFKMDYELYQNAITAILGRRIHLTTIFVMRSRKKNYGNEKGSAGRLNLRFLCSSERHNKSRK